MNEIYGNCDCSLQWLHFIWTVLLEWSWYTNSEYWLHFQSILLPVILGQIKLTWVQNGPVILNIYAKKTIYSLINVYCVNGTNRTICKPVTLYHWQPLKKRPIQGKFCTQSIFQKLASLSSGTKSQSLTCRWRQCVNVKHQIEQVPPQWNSNASQDLETSATLLLEPHILQDDSLTPVDIF
jgi:hypothetical protein